MQQKNDTKTWFSQCIEQNMDSLYALALRLTRNSTDAEDLVAESVAKAWSAIEQLPESFRITVVLINVEGLSYDEAADVLGVSPGTIRSRMNRGRTLLQKALWQHARDAGLITAMTTTECRK